MSEPLLPTSELVARAWIAAAVPSLAGKVATTLPDIPWVDNEFCEIMQVGGGASVDLPVLNPAISINCFAMRPGSTKPPFGQANQMAMKIWLACYAIQYNPQPAVAVDLPEEYGGALVQSVYPLTEPRRIKSDPSQYACYNLDIHMTWIPSSVVVS